MSSIMIVSDVHYVRGYHNNVYEGDALDWLLKTIEARKPDALVGLGDFDSGWTGLDWDKLTGAVNCNCIFGNHDNLALLKSAQNQDGQPVWARNGEIRNINGLRFGFINGIISPKGEKKIKAGVPRISPEEYVHAARKLIGVDILATHNSPNLPEYGSRYHRSIEFDVLATIPDLVHPKIWVGGHLAGPYAVGRLGETLVLRVDSSPQEKHYAILDTTAHRIGIWHDKDYVESVEY